MVWASFRRGLAAVAAERPAAIVIDSFEACRDPVRQQLVLQLLAPVARGEVPNAHVIVASTRLPELERLDGAIRHQVQAFRTDAARTVLGDFVDLLTAPAEEIPDHLDVLNKFIQVHFEGRVVQPAWSAEKFRKIRDIFSAFFS